MARRRSLRPQAGFSLVELLVAVFFTSVLMAGLSTVFRSSLTTFATTGESISNARRNRGAIDLLTDDIHVAAMYLGELSVAPTMGTTNPAFYVLPGMEIKDANAGELQRADQLYLYLDDPLPFEASLPDDAASLLPGMAEKVADGTAVTSAEGTFVLKCKTPVYAKMVKAGMEFVFKDMFQPVRIESVQGISGSDVTVVLAPKTLSEGGTGTAPPLEQAMVTGAGYSGPMPKEKRLPSTGIVVYRPGQMVRYSVVMMATDPKGPKVPCLVRDQGVYNIAGFVADPALRQLITENIAGFKVYLSANSGRGWAGLDAATNKPVNYGAPPSLGGTDFAAAFAEYFNTAWINGMRVELDTQLSTAGRPGHKTTAGNPNWFRSIPCMVRVDVTTRTATQRAEYSANGKSLAHKELAQSLVIVPRHFGLPME